MTQALIWWLENGPRWLSCCSAQWRRQQEVLRAATFHTGHVLCSPAPLPDKLSRLLRRSCSDAITLLHGSGEVQLQLCSQLPAPQHDPCQLYALGQRLQQRTGEACLHGLVDIGRALSR